MSNDRNGAGTHQKDMTSIFATPRHPPVPDSINRDILAAANAAIAMEQDPDTQSADDAVASEFDTTADLSNDTATVAGTSVPVRESTTRTDNIEQVKIARVWPQVFAAAAVLVLAITVVPLMQPGSKSGSLESSADSAEVASADLDTKGGGVTGTGTGSGSSDQSTQALAVVAEASVEEQSVDSIAVDANSAENVAVEDSDAFSDSETEAEPAAADEAAKESIARTTIVSSGGLSTGLSDQPVVVRNISAAATTQSASRSAETGESGNDAPGGQEVSEKAKQKAKENRRDSTQQSVETQSGRTEFVTALAPEQKAVSESAPQPAAQAAPLSATASSANSARQSATATLEFSGTDSAPTDSVDVNQTLSSKRVLSESANVSRPAENDNSPDITLADGSAEGAESTPSLLPENSPKGDSVEVTPEPETRVVDTDYRYRLTAERWKAEILKYSVTGKREIAKQEYRLYIQVYPESPFKLQQSAK